MTSLRRSLSVLILAAGTGTIVIPAAAFAANRPQIEYVQVLNGANHPRTSFSPGQRVNFKIVLYAPSYKARALTVTWRVTEGDMSLLNKSSRAFHGPTRGNLYSDIGGVSLSSHDPKGTYAVQATMHVGGKMLSRTARFYVR